MVVVWAKIECPFKRFNRSTTIHYFKMTLPQSIDPACPHLCRSRVPLMLRVFFIFRAISFQWYNLVGCQCDVNVTSHVTCGGPVCAREQHTNKGKLGTLTDERRGRWDRPCAGHIDRPEGGPWEERVFWNLACTCLPNSHIRVRFNKNKGLLWWGQTGKLVIWAKCLFGSMVKFKEKLQYGFLFWSLTLPNNEEIAVDKSNINNSTPAAAPFIEYENAIPIHVIYDFECHGRIWLPKSLNVRPINIVSR